MNNCLAFDGENDFVDVPGVQAPAAGGPITIEFWNKVDASQVKESYAVYFNTSDDTARCSVHAPWRGNVLIWDYGDLFGNGRLTVDYTPYLGKWTHIALVSKGKGGDFMAIYINGELKASKAASDGPTVALTGFRVGGDGKQYYHRGCIESLRIWSSVRTAAEIKRGMGCDVVGDEEGLVAALSFNQGFGNANNTGLGLTTTVPNRVPGQPNGELKNSARAGSTSNWVASDVVQSAPMAPVYRFFHNARKDHILTADPAELKSLRGDSGWLEEGIAFYAPRGPRPGTTPLYRLFFAGLNDHIYTISAQERATLDPRIDYDAPKSAFVQEAIPCFVHRDPAPGLVPLHRAINATTNDHYYTRTESSAKNTAGYIYEGICAYVYPTIDAPFVPAPIRALPEQPRLSQDVWYLLVPDSAVGVGNRALAINGSSAVLAEIDEKNLDRFLWRCVPNVHAAGKVHLQNKIFGNALDSTTDAPYMGALQAGAVGQAWTLRTADTADRKHGTDKLQLFNDKAGAGKRLTADADGLTIAMTATTNGDAQRWRFVAMECAAGHSVPAPPPALAALPFTKHLKTADGLIDVLGTGTVSDWAMLTARLIYENMVAALRDQTRLEGLRGLIVLVIGRDDSNAATVNYPLISSIMNEEGRMHLYRGMGFPYAPRTTCIITEEMMCKRGVYNRPGDTTTRVFEQTVHEVAHMFDFKLGMNGDQTPASGDANLRREWFAWDMEAWFGAAGSPSQRASFHATRPAQFAYIAPWFDPNNVWSCPPGYVTRY